MNDNLEMSKTIEFDGCDGGDPGSPDSPSIWIFGIEHGIYKSKNDLAYQNVESIYDEDYSVKTQLNWPYNQKAFKLLAAIDGLAVETYKQFAYAKQPFVKGSRGYFKGNLYPYACRNVSDWPAEAEIETGMTKIKYREWCKQNHIPSIKNWVDKYRPKVFIGVGTTNKTQFAHAAFGRDVEFNVFQFSVNGYIKRIFTAKSDDRRLVVVPHLSGSRHGLNSNESLQKAGEYISEFILKK